MLIQPGIMTSTLMSSITYGFLYTPCGSIYPTAAKLRCNSDLGIVSLIPSTSGSNNSEST